jgi:drug/metabolite transporter (DMT)-like permease
MKPSQWLAIIVASIGWASGGIATRAAFNEGVDAWTMIAFRVFFAAVLVGAVVLIRRVPMPSKIVLGYGLTQAVFNLTVPYVLFTFAYDEASAGFVGLLTALIPLSTAVAANFMLPDEPLSKGKLAGLLVAFSGVAFLLLSGDSGLSEGGRPLVAVGLGITAVTSVGFAAAFGKRHAGSYNPSMMTGLQFGFSAIWLLAAMVVVDGVPTDVSARGWQLIVLMATLATFVPFMLYYWLLERVSATNVSLTGYLVPLIVLIAGLVLLDEELQLGIVIGGLLVFAGLVISDRTSRRSRSTVAPEVAETWPTG